MRAYHVFRFILDSVNRLSERQYTVAERLVKLHRSFELRLRLTSTMKENLCIVEQLTCSFFRFERLNRDEHSTDIKDFFNDYLEFFIRNDLKGSSR
jgi:hypothetical protein